MHSDHDSVAELRLIPDFQHWLAFSPPAGLNSWATQFRQLPSIRNHQKVFSHILASSHLLLKSPFAANLHDTINISAPCPNTLRHTNSDGNAFGSGHHKKMPTSRTHPSEHKQILCTTTPQHLHQPPRLLQHPLCLLTFRYIASPAHKAARCAHVVCSLTHFDIRWYWVRTTDCWSFSQNNIFAVLEREALPDQLQLHVSMTASQGPFPPTRVTQSATRRGV